MEGFTEEKIKNRAEEKENALILFGYLKIQ